MFQIVLSHYHPIFCFLQIVTMFQTREMRPWTRKFPLAVLHHVLETHMSKQTPRVFSLRVKFFNPYCLIINLGANSINSNVK